MAAPHVERELTLERPDGQRLAAYHWSAGAPPRAIMVVAHGMGEHAQRYPPALAPLLADGIDIYAIDHRGHGATIALSDGQPGDFGTGGFGAVVMDLLALVTRARAKHPRLPVVLLGHSMGSFVSQAFLVDHWRDIDALVLVGTSALDTVAASIMSEPDIGEALNRNFAPARTPFDWLSSVPEEVDRYIADPLCGFMLSPESMLDMLGQAACLSDPARLWHIRPGFPVYILVGEQDPLGTNLGSVAPLVERYSAVRMAVELATYPDGRHEILNERNRAEVVEALRVWLNAAIAGAQT